MNTENAGQSLRLDKDAFVESVLQLRPKLAVFDCDGTLWSGDAGFGFFEWELTRGLVADDTVRWARARYAEYLAGEVSEDEICADMVTINRGLSETEVIHAALPFFEEKIVGGIFAEIQGLIQTLHANACEVWAVSSTSEWVIRAGMKHFAIPPQRVLAAAVVVDDGKVTDKVIRVPSGKGKPKAIREVVGRTPDAVFGNSIWDADMLEITPNPFVVNPTTELESLAGQRQWPIYFPESVSRP